MATKKIGEKRICENSKNFEKNWVKTPKFQEHKIKY
jgi:hypothetical protein